MRLGRGRGGDGGCRSSREEREEEQEEHSMGGDRRMGTRGRMGCR